MNLRIGHLSTFYHTSILMIARDTMGKETEWRLFGTGPAIVDAFDRGEIDIAYIGLPPAVIGIGRGVNITCIAGGHVEGTVICAGSQFSGFPEIADPAMILGQFRNRKIGVPGKGSIHDVIITELLRKLDLEEDIEIVNFQWADMVLEALYRGDVSAAVGTPALAVAAIRYAGGKILYPPHTLWPNNPSYGILVNQDFYHRENEAVEGFLLLHEEATAFLRNKPREASKIISGYVGIVDEAFVLDTLKVSPKYCASLTDDYIASTMGFVEVLKRLKYIDRQISSDEIFDRSLIEKIHPEKEHYEDGIAVQ